MMKYENEFYTIEADRDRTRAFYVPGRDTGCGCAGCRNFSAALDRMEPTLRAFLQQFGVDPAQPAEMSAVCAPTPGTIFYDGFYHICGQILRGGDLWIQTGPKQFRLREEAVIRLPEDACLHFSGDCHLLPAAFPRPVIQLQVGFCLPWVLAEENPY